MLPRPGIPLNGLDDGYAWYRPFAVSLRLNVGSVR